MSYIYCGHPFSNNNHFPCIHTHNYWYGYKEIFLIPTIMEFFGIEKAISNIYQQIRNDMGKVTRGFLIYPILVYACAKWHDYISVIAKNHMITITSIHLWSVSLS